MNTKTFSHATQPFTELREGLACVPREDLHVQGRGMGGLCVQRRVCAAEVCEVLPSGGSTRYALPSHVAKTTHRTQTEKVIPAICALLPVGGDHLEARIVHEVIFRDYVATKSPFVCGPNGENMEGIKRIAQGVCSHVPYLKKENNKLHNTHSFCKRRTTSAA